MDAYIMLSVIVIGGWGLNLATYLFLRKIFAIDGRIFSFKNMIKYVALCTAWIPYVFFFYVIACLFIIIIIESGRKQ